jgi:hypothetical protein
MTIVRFSHQIESSNLGRDDTDDLFRLTSNRAETTPTGGFADNWHDQTASGLNNITQNPFKLHWYSVKIWTTGPIVLWSSDVEQFKMANPNNDTLFNQFNIANDTIKKYTLTDGGKTWSRMGKAFVTSKRMTSKSGKSYTKRMGRPRYYNNKQFKLQVKNIDPSTSPSDIAYYAIIEGVLEYDAV